jgi:hypothetical protein
MSAISNMSNLKAMVESATAEERAEILALLQPVKKEKVAKAPPAPVLAEGWAVAEPAKKGDHKGKPRWYHAENEEYAYEFPAAVPAVKKTKAPAKPAPVASPVADDEARDKRLMGRMSKEEVAALSKEEKKRRTELKKKASEERKASRSPEEQAKIDEKVAKMKAGRAKSKATAGGSPSAEEAAAEEESGSAEEE